MRDTLHPLSARSLATLLAALLPVTTLALAPLPQDGVKPKSDPPMQEEPAEEPEEMPAGKPAEQPTQNPTTKPVTKPAEPKKPSSRDAQKEREAAKAKAKWFDKLDRDDKAAIEPLLGYAAADFPASAERIGLAVASMKELRGKVVVLQTFSTRNTGAAMTLKKTDEAALAAKVAKDDVVVIGVHTPEGADGAKTAIEKQKITVPVIVDKDGEFCDALGAYRKPIAYVVDRQGNLRYGGLSAGGVTNAVVECAAEAFDESVAPKVRETPKPTEASKAFPTYATPISGANDLRGKPAPAFAVERWYNASAAPNLSGKLTVIDFWATWCGPCVAAIPHMNEIATAYPNDVVCVGVSDESWRNFEDGTAKKRLSKSDFKYSVGIDSQGRMKNGFGIRAIPHVAIVSSDGVVRWQGHPMSLDPKTMNELIAANRLLVSKPGGTAQSGGRWKRK